MDNKRLDELINQTLYEQEPDKDEEEEDTTDTDTKEKSQKEKDKDVDKKNISKIEKKDLEDDATEDVVVAIKFDDNKEEGGQIKLLDAEKLSSMTSIENILKLFDVNPDKVPEGFKDKIEITINSPLSDFKDDEYKIQLMDKIGQISIKRPDFKTTITKKSKGNLEQAVQQAVGGTEGEEAKEEKPAEQVDLSYLPELDVEFARAIKSEFFDRIIQR